MGNVSLVVQEQEVSVPCLQRLERRWTLVALGLFPEVLCHCSEQQRNNCQHFHNGGHYPKYYHQEPKEVEIPIYSPILSRFDWIKISWLSISHAQSAAHNVLTYQLFRWEMAQRRHGIMPYVCTITDLNISNPHILCVTDPLSTGT